MRERILPKHIKSPEEISLSERLQIARMALRDILRPEIVKLLTSDDECRTISDVWEWRDRVVETVIDMAEPADDREMENSDGPRVCCPLCGGSTQSDRRFALPVGLRMHLSGKTSARECSVLRVFREIALENVEDDFIIRLRT
jgi:hypothetical protein